MKKLTPDFKTISDFRKNNVDSIKPVFKEFVFLCKSLDLFGLELVGIDGSKFKAVNSKDKSYFNERKLENSLKLTNEKIERYLKELEENDKNDVDDDNDKEQETRELKEKIDKLEEKRNEYIRIQNEMKESGKKEMTLNDPESRLMKAGRGLDVCYNVESAVDSKYHMVCEYYITNHPSDKNELANVAIGAMKTLGVGKLDATADSGFFDAEHIRECIQNGITPYVTEQKSIGSAKRRGIPTPEFYKSEFFYDKEADAYTCPAGENLWSMYVMDKGKGKRMRVYGTTACSNCPFFLTKCTADRTGRKIYRGLHEELIEEMRQRIKDDPSKTKFRKELCEHPFGTMKRAFNQGYLLLKGLRKVGGEVGFTMLAYNMRRAINVLGTKALIGSARTVVEIH